MEHHCELHAIRRDGSDLKIARDYDSDANVYAAACALAEICGVALEA
jgi:hypothetical protein